VLGQVSHSARWPSYDGYALGLTLSAALLVAAVIVALTVLRRTSPPSQAERTDDRALFPARD
jgi:hypothetical protein